MASVRPVRGPAPSACQNSQPHHPSYAAICSESSMASWSGKPRATKSKLRIPSSPDPTAAGRLRQQRTVEPEILDRQICRGSTAKTPREIEMFIRAPTRADCSTPIFWNGSRHRVRPYLRCLKAVRYTTRKRQFSGSSKPQRIRPIRVLRFRQVMDPDACRQKARQRSV